MNYLPRRQKQLYKWISKRIDADGFCHATLSKMATYFKISIPSVFGSLEELIKKGLIEKVKSPMTNVNLYRLVEVK